MQHVAASVLVLIPPPLLHGGSGATSCCQRCSSVSHARTCSAGETTAITQQQLWQPHALTLCGTCAIIFFMVILTMYGAFPHREVPAQHTIMPRGTCAPSASTATPRYEGSCCCPAGVVCLAAMLECLFPRHPHSRTPRNASTQTVKHPNSPTLSMASLLR